MTLQHTTPIILTSNPKSSNRLLHRAIDHISHSIFWYSACARTINGIRKKEREYSQNPSHSPCMGTGSYRDCRPPSNHVHICIHESIRDDKVLSNVLCVLRRMHNLETPMSTFHDKCAPWITANLPFAQL